MRFWSNRIGENVSIIDNYVGKCKTNLFLQLLAFISFQYVTLDLHDKNYFNDYIHWEIKYVWQHPWPILKVSLRHFWPTNILYIPVLGVFLKSLTGAAQSQLFVTPPFTPMHIHFTWFPIWNFKTHISFLPHFFVISLRIFQFKGLKCVANILMNCYIWLWSNYLKYKQINDWHKTNKLPL